MEHHHTKARPRQGRVSDLLEIFDAPGEPPVETSADDMVSLIMDNRLRVRAVFIRGVDLPADESARLERAIATAVDQAVQEVIKRNSARLIEGLFRRQDRAAARSPQASSPHGSLHDDYAVPGEAPRSDGPDDIPEAPQET